jgi:hypothetical protein
MISPNILVKGSAFIYFMYLGRNFARSRRGSEDSHCADITPILIRLLCENKTHFNQFNLAEIKQTGRETPLSWQLSYSPRHMGAKNYS